MSGSFLDFQISAAKLAEMLLQRLRAQPVCIMQTFTPPTLDQPVLVDHMEFPTDRPPTIGVGPKLDPSHPPPVQTFHVQGPDGPFDFATEVPPVIVSLRVDLYLKTVHDAQKTSAIEHFLPPVPMAGTLVLELSAHDTRLCVEVRDFAIPPFLVDTADPDDLHDQIVAEIRNVIGTICSGLPIGSLQAVIGDGAITNVALSGDGGPGGRSSAIGIRMEIGEPASTAGEWQAFIDHFQPQVLLPLQDWSVKIDSGLVNARVKEIFSEAKIDPTLHLYGQPHPSWHKDGQFGGGREILQLQGTVDGPCGGVDVNPITATFDFELVADGTAIKQHVVIDWQLDEWAIFWCGFALGFSVGELIGSALGPIIASSIADTISNSIDAAASFVEQSPPEQSCKRSDNTHLVCRIPLELQPLDFGAGATTTMKAAMLAGLDDGALLAGSLSVDQVPLAHYVIEFPSDQLEVGIQGSCFQYTTGYTLSVLIKSTTITIPSIELCSLEVLNDPHLLFQPQIEPPNANYLPVTVNFAIPSMEFDDPYWTTVQAEPLLYIRTSAGAHAVKLPALTRPGQTQLDDIRKGIFQSQIDCTKTASGWHGVQGLFDPHWLVDPGPEGEVVNVWDFAMAPPAGHEVRLEDSHGAPIANAAVGREPVVLSTTASGSMQAAVPLRLKRTAPSQHGGAHASFHESERGGSEPHRLVVRQLQLRPCATIAGYGAIDSIHAELWDGEPCVTIGATAGVEVMSLANPNLPTPRAGVRAARGAMSASGEVLHWGDAGLYAGRRRLSDSPSRDAVMRGGLLFVVGGEGLEVYDRRLVRAGALRLIDAQRIVASGRHLAIATARGLVVVDVSTPQRPRIAGDIVIDGPHELSSVRVVYGDNRVLVSRARQHVIFDVSDGPPRRLIEYASRPWFAGMVRLGNIFVRRESRHAVSVWSAAVQRSVIY